MAKYLIATSSKVKPGREDDYRTWYDGVHLADMLKIPGVLSANTYEAAAQSPQTPPLEFVAIYEVDVEDPGTIFAEIGRRIQSGEMQGSDAIEKGTSTTWVYKAR